MTTLNPENSRLPKYVLLADHLRERIESGELAPDERVPSFPQLRGEFGISQNTVEKAHALLEQDGLIFRRQGHGTYVARRTRAQTGLIGFCGLNLDYRHLPYYVALLHGAQREAASREREIVLANSELPSVSRDRLDGVVTFSLNPETVKQKLGPGVPCVALLSESSALSDVLADDYRGMTLATEHLLSLGHRRIAYLHETDLVTVERQRAFVDATQAAGIGMNERWLYPLVRRYDDEYRWRGRETMREWLAGGWRELGCTALLCQNDRTAIGAMEALGEAGIRVPDDVSVVGFDSTDECDLVSPRLTSVRVPLAEMGQAAMKMLLDAIDATAGGRDFQMGRLVLPEQLDVRGSTAVPGSPGM